MRIDGKRNARIGGSLVVVGLVLGVAGLGQHLLWPKPSPDLTVAGRQLQERIDGTILASAAALEPAAVKAAGIKELTAAWKMGADRATYQDLLENEDWWAPLRTRFALSGVVTNSGPVATLGPPVADLATGEIVRGARTRGVASGLLATQGGAVFLAAAARLPPPGARDSATAAGGGAPVVVLGTTFDLAALQSVAGQTGDIVGLSDGAKLLAATGPDASRKIIASIVGHEGEGPASIEGDRLGVAWPVGGHLWLLGVSPAGALTPLSPPGTPLWPMIAGAALVLIGLIALAARGKGAPVDSAAPTPPAAQRPVRRKPVPASRSVARETSVLPDEIAAKLPVNRGWESHGRQSVATVPMDAQVREMPAAEAAQVAPAPAAPVVSAAPGSVQEMGRYRLIERIGEGGMAEIFFAVAHGAEGFVRHFVLKRMHPQLSRQREVVNQFIDEARLQAGLVHSNIVPVFDFGKAGDEYFLALEYIHGRDVGQIVQQHVEKMGRPLDSATAFYILHEVLEALAYAHSQTTKDGTAMEIVHRDVAPGNILVSYRGEVKLTDFGIAKSEKRLSRTDVGMVKGNASFMSPEQARGDLVDARSDIFSAGLVLFYCLTGQFLYRGETTLNRLMRAAVGPATSQFSQIEQLPRVAAQVLRRALALDPDQRYAYAVDFERDVAANMGDRGDLARLLEILFPPSQRRDLR